MKSTNRIVALVLFVLLAYSGFAQTQDAPFTDWDLVRFIHDWFPIMEWHHLRGWRFDYENPERSAAELFQGAEFEAYLKRRFYWTSERFRSMAGSVFRLCLLVEADNPGGARDSGEYELVKTRLGEIAEARRKAGD
jgi:hypothetical protein